MNKNSSLVSFGSALLFIAVEAARQAAPELLAAWMREAELLEKMARLQVQLLASQQSYSNRCADLSVMRSKVAELEGKDLEAEGEAYYQAERKADREGLVADSYLFGYASLN